MKNKNDEKPEAASEEVELVVTQEDYEAGLKRGWTDDDMLKPGRYKFKRGGFLARHPELKIELLSRDEVEQDLEDDSGFVNVYNLPH